MIPIEQFCECSEGSSFVTCDESFNIKSLIYGALKIKLAFKGSFLFIYLVICFIWAEKVNPILNFVFAHFWLKSVGQKQRATTTAVSFRRENVQRKNVHKWSTNKKHDCMKRQMLHFFNAPYWTNPHYIKYKARYYIKIKLNYFLLLIPTTHSLFDYKVKMKCRNLICISL